jgi:hypothetical protein
MTILDSSTGAAARRVDPWLTSRVSRPTCAEPAVRSAKDRFEINLHLIQASYGPICGARSEADMEPACEIPRSRLCLLRRGPGGALSIG